MQIQHNFSTVREKLKEINPKFKGMSLAQVQEQQVHLDQVIHLTKNKTNKVMHQYMREDQSH